MITPESIRGKDFVGCCDKPDFFGDVIDENYCSIIYFYKHSDYCNLNLEMIKIYDSNFERFFNYINDLKIKLDVNKICTLDKKIVYIDDGNKS